MANDLPVRSAGVSVVVLRGEGRNAETLLLRRAGTVFAGAWCQVAGGIEAGETAWEAALRELLEETGLAAQELHSAGICEQFYDGTRYEPGTESIYIAPVFVAFVAADAPVNINWEHSEHRWVKLDAVDEFLATPNQRDMFAHVRRHFVDRSPNQWTRIDFMHQ